MPSTLVLMSFWNCPVDVSIGRISGFFDSSNNIGFRMLWLMAVCMARRLRLAELLDDQLTSHGRSRVNSSLPSFLHRVCDGSLHSKRDHTPCAGSNTRGTQIYTREIGFMIRSGLTIRKPLRLCILIRLWGRMLVVHFLQLGRAVPLRHLIAPS